jgi:hypothetical protein
MLTPVLHAIVSSWLDVLWVVDHFRYTWETVKHENPSDVAVLDKPVDLTPTTTLRSKGTYISLFTLYMGHIHLSNVSRLKNLSLTCLLHFIYAD